MMDYYDQIQFIDGKFSAPCLSAPPCRRYPEWYALQYDTSPSRVFYSVDHGPRQVVETPVLYLHHPDRHYEFGPCGYPESTWNHGWVLFTGEKGRRMFEGGFMKALPDGIMELTNDEEFGGSFHRLLGFVHGRRPYDKIRACLELEHLLCLVWEMTLHRRERVPYGHFIQSVAAKVENAPLRSWDFHELARQGGLSHTHFRRLFKSIVGHAPLDYHLLCRIRYAARLFRERNLSVKEAAAACGFDNHSYFSRQFKKRIGLSPREYAATVARMPTGL